MNKLKSILLIISCVLCARLFADITVTATGQATGKGRLVREQALADALRNAIRKGAGVNIISSSRTTDYVLDFDRVFSRAFGYVKKFKVISCGYDNTGIYNLKVSAVISKAPKDMNDYLAMRQIIAMKGSPRLLIRTQGKITDIGDANKLLAGQLREIALGCGFQTVKISQFKEAEAKRDERDSFIGKSKSSSYRKSNIRSNYDFLIDVEISGSYNGQSELYGINTQRFSLGADLCAVYPNGNTIAQVTIPSKDIDIGRVSGKTQAARAALQKVMGDEKSKNFRALLMRILAVWISEFDTGSKITLEFDSINREMLDRIITGLKQASGINAVHIRQFDEKSKSFIEVESNLKSYDLAALTASISNGNLKADHITNDYIQMEIVKGYSTAQKAVAVSGVVLVILLLIMTLKTLKAAKQDGSSQ